jgi:hypothetical protein
MIQWTNNNYLAYLNIQKCANSARDIDWSTNQYFTGKLGWWPHPPHLYRTPLDSFLEELAR